MEQYFILNLLLVVTMLYITCPTEGYIAGWSDWSDWSDQELQSSPWKRQNELTMSDAGKPKTQLNAEKSSDGECMSCSEDNNEIPDNTPNRIKPLTNQMSTDDQNNETDGKKRNDKKIADGLKEKDVYTNRQQNNENGNPFTGYNTAAILIFPMPPRHHHKMEIF